MAFTALRKTTDDTTINLLTAFSLTAKEAYVEAHIMAYCTSGLRKGRCNRIHLKLLITEAAQSGIFIEEYDQVKEFPISISISALKDHPPHTNVIISVTGPKYCSVTWVGMMDRTYLDKDGA